MVANRIGKVVAILGQDIFFLCLLTLEPRQPHDMLTLAEDLQFGVRLRFIAGRRVHLFCHWVHSPSKLVLDAAGHTIFVGGYTNPERSELDSFPLALEDTSIAMWMRSWASSMSFCRKRR